MAIAALIAVAAVTSAVVASGLVRSGRDDILQSVERQLNDARQELDSGIRYLALVNLQQRVQRIDEICRRAHNPMRVGGCGYRALQDAIRGKLADFLRAEKESLPPDIYDASNEIVKAVESIACGFSHEQAHSSGVTDMLVLSIKVASLKSRLRDRVEVQGTWWRLRGHPTAVPEVSQVASRGFP